MVHETVVIDTFNTIYKKICYLIRRYKSHIISVSRCEISFPENSKITKNCVYNAYRVTH